MVIMMPMLENFLAQVSQILHLVPMALRTFLTAVRNAERWLILCSRASLDWRARFRAWTVFAMEDLLVESDGSGKRRLSRSEVPQSGRPVYARAEHLLPIPAEGDGIDRTGMPVEPANLLTRFSVP